MGITVDEAPALPQGTGGREATPACGSAVLPHTQHVGEGTQEGTSVDSAQSASFRRRRVRSELRSRGDGDLREDDAGQWRERFCFLFLFAVPGI